MVFDKDEDEDLNKAQEGSSRDSAWDNQKLEPKPSQAIIFPSIMRTFPTGATRNADENKPDPEGFFSPLVLAGFSDYMHSHRTQADGSVRESGNWKKGIPIAAYQSSLIRHVFTAWNTWDGFSVKPEQVGLKLVTPTLKDTLYAILFNVMGYLHELEKVSPVAQVKVVSWKGSPLKPSKGFDIIEQELQARPL